MWSTPRASQTAFTYDGDVASDLHLARLPVDIDDADMATERKHEVRGIVEGRRIEDGLDAFWQVARHVGRPRNFLDRLCGLRRALHDELPVRELEIFLSGFEEMRRNLSRLVLHLAGG